MSGDWPVFAQVTRAHVHMTSLTLTLLILGNLASFLVSISSQGKRRSLFDCVGTGSGCMLCKKSYLIIRLLLSAGLKPATSTVESMYTLYSIPRMPASLKHAEMPGVQQPISTRQFFCYRSPFTTLPARETQPGRWTVAAATTLPCRLTRRSC